MEVATEPWEKTVNYECRCSNPKGSIHQYDCYAFHKGKKIQAKLTWEARDAEVEEAEKRGMRKVVDTMLELDKQAQSFLSGYVTPETANRTPDKYLLIVPWDKLQAFLKKEGIWTPSSVA